MNESKGDRYQRLTRRAHVAEVTCGTLWLSILAFTRASRSIADGAAGFSRAVPGPLQAVVSGALFVAIVLILWEIAVLPVVLYLGLVVDRRFGKGETLSDVVIGHAHSSLVGLTAALAVSVTVMMTMAVAGAWWWLTAGIVLAGAFAAVQWLAPAFLPALGDVRPIARPTLMSGLREIARRSGVTVSDILEWRVEERAQATALVAGTGRRRRVFVATEIVRDWSDDEIAVVVAHELAHHVYADMWRTLALDAGLLSVALWLADAAVRAWAIALGIQGSADLAALPLIALVASVVWLTATPLRLAQSRAHERRADRFALKLTGEAGAFGAAVRRLSMRHLAEERPSAFARWFFHRHPPVAERLALAEHFRKL